MLSLTESLRQAKAAYTLIPLDGRWTVARRDGVLWQSDEMMLEGARSWRKFLTAWRAVELYTGMDRGEHEALGRTMTLNGDSDMVTKNFLATYNLNRT